jgi:polar amino acid transport system substrate-binding protein
MSYKRIIKIVAVTLVFLMTFIIAGCSGSPKITNISQLSDKLFAVPSGTAADQLVKTKFPNATFVYYDTILQASLAVKNGQADAAAYDQPILKNITAQNSGLTVLPDFITNDNYAFAVKLGNTDLKNTIDAVITKLKASGTYDQMLTRWLPDSGSPQEMPAIDLPGTKGTLRFGTAAVTEPFSFIDSKKQIVGFDIELATYVAKELNMKLEIVNMDFNEMIPSLEAGKVDLIGSLLTITEDRSKTVLFSTSYYAGGIAALVSK